MDIYSKALANYINGNLTEAVSSLEKLPVEKYKEKEWILYGSSKSQLGEADVAIESFKNALKKNSNSVPAMQNLAKLYQESGEYESAGKLYKRMPRKAIESLTTYLNLGEYHKLCGDYGVAADYFKKSISSIVQADNSLSPTDASIAMMRLLTLSYLLNDYEEVLRMCALLLKERAQKGASRATAAYIQLIAKLTKENGYLSKKEVKQFGEKLFAIGESHILPLHNQNVLIDGKQYKIESKWIEGLKAYHIGSDDKNKYKSSLKCIVNKLPPNSTILMVAGEIDTRADSGILPAAKKSNLDFVHLAEKTVSNYVEQMGNFAASHDLIFWGVPKLPSTGTSELSEPEEIETLILTFNEALKAKASTCGHRFCDVFNASAKVGESGYWDRRHLKSAMVEYIFSEYLI